MSSVFSPRVSVVINTLNRAKILKEVLKSFLWLRYPGEFELIVVNGPSIDETEAVLTEWAGKIRVGHCPEANLSMSRNIGIKMAAGDFVVFIDDDAFPEPDWLCQLIEAFDSPSVACVSGCVYDHTGFNLQYSSVLSDRICGSRFNARENQEFRCFPFSFEFPRPSGGNVAFRRSVLWELGGFDEEIEYYGDETELTVRLIDAGYVVRNVKGGYIHHKSAPSNIRCEKKVLRNWYPVLKNHVYFSMRHARGHLSLVEIQDSNRRFVEFHRDSVMWHFKNGNLSDFELMKFEDEVIRALADGIARANFQQRLPLLGECKFIEDFSLFKGVFRVGALSIVLICQYYPPEFEGGIPTFTRDLAEALAQEGNIVHVVAQSPDISRVDFENGVWVHRLINEKDFLMPEKIRLLKIPQRIWNWSACALEEVHRISKSRKIDVIEAPIWDCQGAAFLFDGTWPLVTSLHTTLRFWMDSNPKYANDPNWLNEFGSPMLALEQRLMECADAIRANSKAIVTSIESVYPMRFDQARTIVVPHGMPEHRADLTSMEDNTASHAVTILFVGRLEKRKGIDILLRAAPLVLKECPEARFRILGDDTLPADNGLTYKNAFLNSSDARACGDKVRFEGRVSQEVLDAAYQECDVFVAPSRFESFGLVFLEAMRAGKPVIGCRAGGMPEVVDHEVNGLLPDPEDVQGLANSLIRLVKSPKLRATMGAAGFARFKAKFTSKRMAQGSIPLYQLAIDNHPILAK